MIEQRNSLLRSLRREGVPPNSETATGQLSFWDQELIRLGSLLIAHRAVTIRKLSALAEIRFEWLAKSSTLGVAYSPSLDGDWMIQSQDSSTAEGIQGVVAREYEMRLPQVRAEELRRGVTLLGPHRDDITLEIEGHDLAAFGSRGQQRLAVVALKLAEADLMRQETSEEPVLLLDDVLSELDPEHRSLLLKAISESGGQVILTSADPKLLQSDELAGIPTAKASNGTIDMAQR
jgi:DNA replication and repair protein RecF